MAPQEALTLTLTLTLSLSLSLTLTLSLSLSLSLRLTLTLTLSLSLSLAQPAWVHGGTRPARKAATSTSRASRLRVPARGSERVLRQSECRQG